MCKCPTVPAPCSYPLAYLTEESIPVASFKAPPAPLATFACEVLFFASSLTEDEHTMRAIGQTFTALTERMLEVGEI